MYIYKCTCDCVFFIVSNSYFKGLPTAWWLVREPSKPVICTC